MKTVRKVIICDDEEDARLLIRQYLQDFSTYELSAECSNGLEAITIIDQVQPDLIFLDIQMPGANGFEVMRSIKQVAPTIFCTAYDQFAVKAFDSNAIDYLLKPYTRERFMIAMAKVATQSAASLEALRNLSEQFRNGFSSFPQKIFVESGSRMISLTTGEIIWIEADGDYSRLHTADRFYISNFGLSALEQKLDPSCFLRVHRSAIVNIGKVQELIKEPAGYVIVLNNHHRQRIGRSYQSFIRKLRL